MALHIEMAIGAVPALPPAGSQPGATGAHAAIFADCSKRFFDDSMICTNVNAILVILHVFFKEICAHYKNVSYSYGVPIVYYPMEKGILMVAKTPKAYAISHIRNDILPAEYASPLQANRCIHPG